MNELLDLILEYEQKVSKDLFLISDISLSPIVNPLTENSIPYNRTIKVLCHLKIYNCYIIFVIKYKLKLIKNYSNYNHILCKKELLHWQMKTFNNNC